MIDMQNLCAKCLSPFNYLFLFFKLGHAVTRIQGVQRRPMLFAALKLPREEGHSSSRKIGSGRVH
jgi:hypothetical protein